MTRVLVGMALLLVLVLVLSIDYWKGHQRYMQCHVHHMNCPMDCFLVSSTGGAPDYCPTDGQPASRQMQPVDPNGFSHTKGSFKTPKPKTQ